MRVEDISLKCFRNYENCHVTFSPGINVISGANAQGKTNLLEAVFMLSGGRSFRTRFDRELIGFQHTRAEITASVHSGDRDQTICIQLAKGSRKRITRNGVRETGAELSKTLAVVLFCPDDLNLIKEGAASRRRLMDLAISQLRPGYAALLAEYNRLYEHKSRILKDWREKPALLELLDTFSDQMCRCSAQMIRYRAAFVKRLQSAAAVIHQEFSGEKERLSLAYTTVSTVRDPLSSTAELYEDLCQHQETHRKAELESGQCLTGVHKDEIVIAINDILARSYASQGQARTAALSLKLAERDIFLDALGEAPVLLLDDVLSELDSRRQAFILNHIGGGQTLITCCEDRQIVERTGGTVLFIRDGSVVEGE
ncbi:MAG: DNA replication/repair protein RecF [Oscillospiraceae bacterium]|jgi:DNA replication and repair protein RecF